MVKVVVQWGKQTFKDVPLDQSEGKTGLDFKKTLFELTGVPVDRQKVMGIGALLKDDTVLKSVKVKEGQIVKLMGSAENLPEAPKEKVVFAEDMGDEDEQEAILSSMPPGLINLGNTCYANSAIQCLKSVPELKNAVLSYAPVENSPDITQELSKLWQDMDKSVNAPAPGAFLTAFRKAYPQFGETVQSAAGMQTYAQQDADEFMNSLLTSIGQKVDTPSNPVVSKLFKGEFQVKFQNTEGDEPAQEQTETFNKLSAYIETETRTMQAGIEKSLVESVEKFSNTLQKKCVYTKTCKIKKLPNYLIVNFVRFFWKAKQKVKAKIVKDVKFPMVLDVFEYCTEEYKNQLKPIRDKLRQEKEQELLNKYKQPADQKPAEATQKPQEDLDAAWYELTAVVTHQGRTADSGHYVGWVKQDKRWLKFDDQKVSEVTEEEIKKLSGGGDWHTAYLLIYKKMNQAP